MPAQPHTKAPPLGMAASGTAGLTTLVARNGYDGPAPPPALKAPPHGTSARAASGHEALPHSTSARAASGHQAPPRTQRHRQMAPPPASGSMGAAAAASKASPVASGSIGAAT